MTRTFFYLRYPAVVAIAAAALTVPLLANLSGQDYACAIAFGLLNGLGLNRDNPSAAASLYVEQNQGQASTKYQFYSRRGNGVPALFSAAGLMIDIGKLDGSARKVQVELVGGAARVRPRGEDRLPTLVHYFLGKDPTQWIKDVPTFARIRYPEVYPGVDAVYYPSEDYFEQDFELRPGVDPRVIRMQFRGADSVRLEAGAVYIAAGKEVIVWKAPQVYQRDRSRKKVTVAAKYQRDESGNIGFALGDYDRSRPLVIDPVITFSTYFGRAGADVAGRSAVDTQGNLYFAGQTDDPAFPVIPGTNPTPKDAGSTGNATLVKLNAAGTEVLTVTHFGGSVGDLAAAVAVDAGGNIYLTGITNSEDFPVTSGALRTQAYSSDRSSCFVTKFNPAANRILYSTYLGGSQMDACSAIAVDAAGAMYVAGATNSQNFPATPDSVQPTFRSPSGTPGFDGFVSKLNPAGSALVFSTFLGGPGNDVIAAMVVDSNRNVYVTGYTNSPNFPVTQRAFQTTYGGGSSAWFDIGFPVGDAFAAKLSEDGSSLIYSTYLGGREDDVALSIAVDRNGSAYIAGGTRSANFPVTAGALQTTYRGSGGEARYPAGDGFAVKLKPDGTGVDYATYLGGSMDDRAMAIAVDGDGNAWLAGHTLSADFPVSSDARQKSMAGSAPSQLITLGDAFAVQLNPQGSRILYSTYHGGSGNEAGYGLLMAPDGGVIVSGATGSANLFTTSGVVQARGGIGEPDAAPFNDLFVFRIGEPPALPAVSISSVVNEASRVGELIAPGMLVAITGQNLATTEATAVAGEDGRLPETLEGTSVSVGGSRARILSISPQLIIAVMPFGLTPGSTVAVSVEASPGNLSPEKLLSVFEASPGFYADSATAENGIPAGEGNPALAGTVLTLTGTGAGMLNPAVEDGAITGSENSPVPVLPALVLLGDRELQVVSFRSAEGQVAGRFVLAVRIPDDLAAGWYTLSLRVGDAQWSQPEFYVYAGGVLTQGGREGKR